MSLKYEPASVPQHVSVKWLFLEGLIFRCSPDGSVISSQPGQLCHIHPGGNPGANLRSISHRCHPILVAFVWELTKGTIHLPLGCLQGGVISSQPGQLCHIQRFNNV